MVFYIVTSETTQSFCKPLSVSGPWDTSLNSLCLIEIISENLKQHTPVNCIYCSVLLCVSRIQQKTRFEGKNAERFYRNYLLLAMHLVSKQKPTKEAAVVSRWERVPKHHHRGVNNDLLTLAGWGGDFKLTPTPIQPQGELSAEPIQLHLMPFPIIQAVVRQWDIVISVSQVVENSQ